MKNFFREQRDSMSKTQRTIAAELGITDAAVGRWETNLASPRLSMVAKLAVVYGVSEDRMIREIAALASTVLQNRETAAASTDG